MRLLSGPPRAATLGMCTVLLSACAGVNVTTIKDHVDPTAAKAADAKADGIRYYEQVPYLLVYADSRGGMRSELLYLPDTSKKKIIDPYAWGANNKLVLTFDKGVLTSHDQTVDDTVIPRAIVEAAKTALIAAADAAKESKDEVPPPALYRLWVNENGTIELIGGYGTGLDGTGRQNLHVTVSQPSDGKPEAAAK